MKNCESRVLSKEIGGQQGNEQVIVRDNIGPLRHIHRAQSRIDQPRRMVRSQILRWVLRYELSQLIVPPLRLIASGPRLLLKMAICVDSVVHVRTKIWAVRLLNDQGHGSSVREIVSQSSFGHERHLKKQVTILNLAHNGRNGGAHAYAPDNFQGLVFGKRVEVFVELLVDIFLVLGLFEATLERLGVGLCRRIG